MKLCETKVQHKNVLLVASTGVCVFLPQQVRDTACDHVALFDDATPCVTFTGVPTQLCNFNDDFLADVYLCGPRLLEGVKRRDAA